MNYLNDDLIEEIHFASVKGDAWVIRYIDNPPENLQLLALENEWTRHFYEEYIKDLPNKTDYFHREFNRLKLTKGPLK